MNNCEDACTTLLKQKGECPSGVNDQLTFGKDQHYVEKLAKRDVSISIRINQIEHVFNERRVRSESQRFGKFYLG